MSQNATLATRERQAFIDNVDLQIQNAIEPLLTTDLARSNLRNAASGLRVAMFAIAHDISSRPREEARDLTALLNANASISVPFEAIECLRDVVSHAGDFRDALNCRALRARQEDRFEQNEHVATPNNDNVSYWQKQLDVFERMVQQAAGVLRAIGEQP